MRKAPIVFLRGINFYGQEHILFKNFREFFTDRGFEVITPQFKGFTIDKTLEVLREEIKEKYKLDRFIILGYSLGGLLAQRYYDDYPDEVLGMVLVNPVGSEGVSWRIVFKLFKNIAKGLASFSFRKMMRLISYGSNFSDEEVKYYMSINLKFKIWESSWLIFELIPSMGKKIRNVEIPTFIVEGDRDNLLDLDYIRKLANKLGADHYIILGAAHLIVAEPKLWKEAANEIYGWLLKNNLK